MLRRVVVSCLLLILFLLCASTTAQAGDPKPRRTIGICFHPHGPQHHRWSYLPGGSLVTGKDLKLALELVPEMPLYYFDPRASPENQKLLRKLDPKKPCEPAPPVKAPTPPPVAKSKPPPPKKEVEEGGESGGGDGSGSGSGSGSGEKPVSIEERVERFRVRSEDPPEQARRSPPPPQAVLSNEPQLPRESGILSEEGVLPSRDEVRSPKCVDPQCTMVDRGGALPEIQHRQGRPLVSVAPCGQTKEGCKGEGEGNGGKKEEETDFDKLAQQLALAAGLADDPSHDLRREDGKKHGIVGGEDPDGFNHPALQAAIAFLQLSAVARAQVTAFEAQLKAAGKKNLPVVIHKTEELSKEAIEYLRKKYGKKKLAGSLAQMEVIGPYDVMSQFTDGLEGVYQAHHILEKAMAAELRITKELDKIPSVILTEADHKAITAALKELTPLAKSRAELLDAYRIAYAHRPHWIKAIEPYFQ